MKMPSHENWNTFSRKDYEVILEFQYSLTLPHFASLSLLKSRKYSNKLPKAETIANEIII